MTSPLEDNRDKEKAKKLLRHIQQQRESQLTSREYLYRDPKFEDIRFSIIKILLFGGIAAILVFGNRWTLTAWLPGINIGSDIGQIFMAILVMCLVMVVDAIFGLMHTSVEPPSRAAYFFPIQNADWGLLPLPLLYFGVPIFILYKCGTILMFG